MSPDLEREGRTVGLTAVTAIAVLLYTAIAIVNFELAQTVGIGFIIVLLGTSCWKRYKSPLRVRRP